MPQLTIREQIMTELLRRAKTYLSSATRDPIRRREDDLPRPRTRSISFR